MSRPDRAEEFVFQLARHERLLAAYVLALVPHPQDADDLLQETKLVMWRSFDQFQSGTNFAAWARTIAFHRVLAFRKRRRRDRLEFSEQFLAAVAAEHEASSEQLERRDRALHDCLARLPAGHREVVQLRYQEALPLDAMAARLGRTVAALYRQLSRIRRALHECVTQTLSRPDYELPV